MKVKDLEVVNVRRNCDDKSQEFSNSVSNSLHEQFVENCCKGGESYAVNFSTYFMIQQNQAHKGS